LYLVLSWLVLPEQPYRLAAIVVGRIATVMVQLAVAVLLVVKVF